MVLPRAFSLLRLLANRAQGMNLSAMATVLEVPKSSLSTTLRSLVDQGLLRREGSLYFLGPEAFGLAAAILAGRTLRHIARPYLERTMASTGETVVLAELDASRENASNIDIVESTKSIRYSVSIGTLRPLYSTAAGRVFLASFSQQQRDAYFAHTTPEKCTDQTITDRARLDEALAEVRRKGVAVTMGEYSPDAAGFASPIYNPDGEVVAALVIGVPLSRARRERDRFAGEAIRAGQDISRVLGYGDGGSS